MLLQYTFFEQSKRDLHRLLYFYTYILVDSSMWFYADAAPKFARTCNCKALYNKLLELLFARLSAYVLNL